MGTAGKDTFNKQKAKAVGKGLALDVFPQAILKYHIFEASVS